MSEYKYLPLEDFGLTHDDVVFLKVVKPVFWHERFGSLLYPNRNVPVGSITWVKKGHGLRNNKLSSDSSVLLEKNRHGVNYDPSSFELYNPELSLPDYSMKVLYHNVQESCYNEKLTRFIKTHLTLRTTSNSNFSEHGL